MTDHDGRGRFPEQPRSEPEIIPPTRPQRPTLSYVWISGGGQGGAQRVYMARPGPFAIVLALAILGLVVGLVLIVLLSIALLWIPIVIAIVLAVVGTVTIRRYWQRLKHWTQSR